ncbi:MAG: hypothetical protein WCW13_03625 [archaeon]
MGFLNFLKNKKEVPQTEADRILDGENSSEVIIPNHAKPKEEVALVKVKPTAKAAFRVTGVYAVGGDVMLSGHSETGVIKKKMKAKIKDKESVVLDIKKGSNSVSELAPNEEGTIFLRGKNLFLVRTEDLLEFK